MKLQFAKQIGLAAATALLVSSCTTPYSTPTGYTAAGSPTSGKPFGYSDQSLGNDEYSIVVTGNPKTDQQRVMDIAMLRAAHIAQAQHRTHFIVLNQTTEQGSNKETVFAPIGGLLVWLPVGEKESQTPRAVLLIRLLPADSPPAENALSASDVIGALSKRVG